MIFFSMKRIYHSFSHHSRFSSPSETECLANINRRLFSSADTILKAQRMILTFGTAWVYKLKSSGKVVSNCHRLPEKMFDRQLLTVGEIVAEWKSLLLSLWKQNPELKILFTVSPIRHWKDGAHGNQLSKATLLLAIDALQKEFPEHTAYFPAYEIMMDELRSTVSMPTICCIHPPRRSNISGNGSQAACFHLIRCQFLKNGRISKRPLTTSRFNRKAKPINDSSRKLC